MTNFSRKSRSEKSVGVHIETRAIHEGAGFRGETRPVSSPVYFTSIFEWGNSAGFDYTRSGNPNFDNLGEVLASLENAQYATVFSSGVAAITAVVSTLKSGDTVLAEENIYGNTYRLFAQVFEKFGIEVEYLDFSEAVNYQRIIDKKPTLVWLESPTNPLLKIIDIAEISEIAHTVGSTVVVDNTFASPLFQRPLELGADLSLISTTKYVNGHSDCLGGAVATNSEEWKEKMVFAQKALGLNPSPFEAWLVMRGAKTLAMRMEKHEANALAIAKFFENFRYARFVRYPFLPSHPQYKLARQQMLGGSGIVSAEFDLSLDETLAFLSKLKLFTLAVSLGGVESLVCHPATMSHSAVPRETRERVGISDSLVRFSVGVEHVEDLIADIEQAFFQVKPDDDYVAQSRLSLSASR